MSYYPSPGFSCYHTMVAARLQSQRQNLRLTVLAGAIREMRSLAAPVSTAREDSICTWKQSPFLWVWIPPSINSESGNIRRDTYQTHNLTGGGHRTTSGNILTHKVLTSQGKSREADTSHNAKCSREIIKRNNNKRIR